MFFGFKFVDQAPSGHSEPGLAAELTMQGR